MALGSGSWQSNSLGQISRNSRIRRQARSHPPTHLTNSTHQLAASPMVTFGDDFDACAVLKRRDLAIWPDEFPKCDPDRNVILSDKQYWNAYNKLTRIKRRLDKKKLAKQKTPSYSTVDGLRGEKYTIFMVGDQLYDASVESRGLPPLGTVFTRMINKKSDVEKATVHVVSAYGIGDKYKLTSTQIRSIRGWEEVLLARGVTREVATGKLVFLAKRMKRQTAIERWVSLGAKVERREEVKCNVAAALAKRARDRWAPLAAKLARVDEVKRNVAEAEAKRKQARYLVLWHRAIRQVRADLAAARPVVALEPKGNKNASIVAAPGTRIYAPKLSAKKKTTPPPRGSVGDAKRVVDRDANLAALAAATEDKRAAAAADAAAREARADARRLAREIGGC